MKYFFLTLLLITSCIKNAKVNLQNDLIVGNHFNNFEINYLNNLLTKFDSFVIKQTTINDKKSAYIEFSQSLKKIESSNELIEIFNKSRDIEFLTNELIKDSTFYNIWNFEFGYDYISKDTLSISIIPNTSGKYLSFLREVAEKNEYIDYYTESLMSTSDISPSSTSSFLTYSLNVDYTCNLNRLIFAVHYLTINSERYPNNWDEYIRLM